MQNFPNGEVIGALALVGVSLMLPLTLTPCCNAGVPDAKFANLTLCSGHNCISMTMRSSGGWVAFSYFLFSALCFFSFLFQVSLKKEYFLLFALHCFFRFQFHAAELPRDIFTASSRL